MKSFFTRRYFLMLCLYYNYLLTHSLLLNFPQKKYEIHFILHAVFILYKPYFSSFLFLFTVLNVFLSLPLYLYVKQPTLPSIYFTLFFFTAF